MARQVAQVFMMKPGHWYMRMSLPRNHRPFLRQYQMPSSAICPHLTSAQNRH